MAALGCPEANYRTPEQAFSSQGTHWALHNELTMYFTTVYNVISSAILH